MATTTDDVHQQLFQTFTPTRPVTVEELDALAARSDHEMTRITPSMVLWWMGMAVYHVGSALLGGLVLDRMSLNFGVGLIVGVFVGSALSAYAFRLVMVFLPKDNVGSVKRLWQEAGIESPAGVTMKADEARVLIKAPGTTSGVETRAERA